MLRPARFVLGSVGYKTPSGLDTGLETQRENCALVVLGVEAAGPARWNRLERRGRKDVILTHQMTPRPAAPSMAPIAPRTSLASMPPWMPMGLIVLA